MRATEQGEAEIKAARQTWRTELVAIDPKRLVFIDESAVLTNPVRTHARSPRGERACGTAPCGHWTRLTVLGALGPEGIVGAMSIEAATSGAVFHADLEQVLLPALKRSKPDAVIVMDNLSAHKAAAGRDPLKRSGFACRHRPPYSPDFTPIEPAWAKVKTRLRTTAARTTTALHTALGPARDAHHPPGCPITPQDARGSFRKAGYAVV